jgi:hypothetical protein
MKTPKIQESAEQKQQRIRAESENLSAVQEGLGSKTNMFRRLKSPRVSIATSRRQ